MRSRCGSGFSATAWRGWPRCTMGDRSLDAGALDAINLDVRTRYNRAGHGWITTTVLGDRRVLRVTVMNPRTTRAHLAAMLDELSREALVLAVR